MKRSLALAFLFASSLAFADVTTTVTSGNTFGVLRVDVGTAEQVIIAIPWLAASTEDKDIKVTDVIKTANLTVGDELYYYNTSTKRYQVWKLNDSKTWGAATDVSDTTEAASSDATLKRGDAILLKRPNTKSNSIYLYGQVPSSSTCKVTMAQGTATAPAYTLIAPPAVSATDLNSAATWANVATGDAIVLDAGTVLNYVTIDGTQKWAKWTGFENHADTYDTSAATIPAGQGAWYMSQSTSETTVPTVTWTGLPSTSASN